MLSYYLAGQEALLKLLEPGVLARDLAGSFNNGRFLAGQEALLKLLEPPLSRGDLRLLNQLPHYHYSLLRGIDRMAGEKGYDWFVSGV